MDIAELSPKSIVGIKRLATRLKKAQGIKLSRAQDLSAQQAGFDSFYAAQSILSAVTPQQTVIDPYAHLRKIGIAPTLPNTDCRFNMKAKCTSELRIASAGGHLRSNKIAVTIAGHFECEGRPHVLTTQVCVSNDIGQFITNKILAGIPCGLGSRKITGKNRITAHLGKQSVFYASELIARIARHLQVRDATGLDLVNVRAGHRKGKALEKCGWVPEGSHGHMWRDPETKALIEMDQPYHNDPRREPCRTLWAAEHGFEIERLAWGGTYFPEGDAICDLVSCLTHGFPIAEFVARMQTADPCFTGIDAQWDHSVA